MNSLQDLAKLLTAVANKEVEPPYSGAGICYMVTRNNARHYSLVKEIIAAWPKHSGNRLFPIPHADYPAGIAYVEIHNLWDNTDYGNLRRELCWYIAEEIKEKHLK